MEEEKRVTPVSGHFEIYRSLEGFKCKFGKFTVLNKWREGCRFKMEDDFRQADLMESVSQLTHLEDCEMFVVGRSDSDIWKVLDPDEFSARISRISQVSFAIGAIFAFLCMYLFSV